MSARGLPISRVTIQNNESMIGEEAKRRAKSKKSWNRLGVGTEIVSVVIGDWSPACRRKPRKSGTLQYLAAALKPDQESGPLKNAEGMQPQRRKKKKIKVFLAAQGSPRHFIRLTCLPSCANISCRQPLDIVHWMFGIEPEAQDIQIFPR